LRTVFQSLSSRQEEMRGIKKLGRETGRWLKSLSALGSRLRWRSHFAQKLSDQPSIEHDNMCRAYDVLRTEHDQAKLDAWTDGRTGYPMVDACMRSLEHSGWLNFRMRAMLVSFACYDLWLDWRPLAPILARRFLDYEPGIHYPQLQMQAGTTGMNANRIYSATKQVPCSFAVKTKTSY
jgi:deoxyribodipyrimidine photo-lyase